MSITSEQAGQLKIGTRVQFPGSPVMTMVQNGIKGHNHRMVTYFHDGQIVTAVIDLLICWIVEPEAKESNPDPSVLLPPFSAIELAKHGIACPCGGDLSFIRQTGEKVKLDANKLICVEYEEMMLRCDTCDAFEEDRFPLPQDEAWYAALCETMDAKLDMPRRSTQF